MGTQRSHGLLRASAGFVSPHSTAPLP
jgi:hypothetical protein